MIRILKITVTPILMLLLLGACSKKPLIEQSSIEVRSKEVVSIEAVKGYERYSWRQISGMPVEIEDAKSRILRFIAPDVTQKEELVFELGAYTGNIELKAEARVTVLPLNSDIDKEDENGTQESEEDNATDKESGTSPIQSLTLHIKKSSLNKDTNTTYTLTAKYRDGKKETVSENIEWIITPKDAIKIEGSTITAIKDTDVTIQARYKGRVSDPITLHIYWEVDGYRLPPEPDPKINNATLLGVDSNNNGVRDDVERWIYKTYSHPIERGIFMQSAWAYNKVIVDPSKAHETTKYYDNSYSCSKYWRLNNDYLKKKYEFEYMNKKLEKIQFNTIQRHIAYEKFNAAFSGETFSSPEANKSKCLFDKNGILQVRP